MSELTYNPLIAGIEEIRRSWGWFLALGILLSILGIACIAFDVTATFATRAGLRLDASDQRRLCAGSFVPEPGPGADSSSICSVRYSGDSPDTC